MDPVLVGHAEYYDDHNHNSDIDFYGFGGAYDCRGGTGFSLTDPSAVGIFVFHSDNHHMLAGLSTAGCAYIDI